MQTTEKGKMKTKISHFFGNQEDFDLQLVKLSLDLENSKESEALENGWLIYDNVWYTCRSSRIEIDNYSNQLNSSSSKKKIKNYTFEYKEVFTIDESILRVYNRFLEIKKFKKFYPLEKDLDRSSGVFVYNKENELVAFTKMVKYDGGIESQFTCWDYSEPRASIGRYLVDYEIEACKDLGYKYLYIGPVYGLGSVYKMNFSGFQWWDGENWSSDDHKLFKILERDSLVKTMEDLSNAFIQNS